MQIRIHVVHRRTILVLTKLVVHLVRRRLSIEVIMTVHPKRMFIIVLGNKAWAQLGRRDIVMLLHRSLARQTQVSGTLSNGKWPSSAELTWSSLPIRFAIAHGSIWSPLLLWPFHKGTASPVSSTELARRGYINLACNLPRPTKVAWSVLARLVRPWAGLDLRCQFESVEEVGWGE
jgi:hypothetical protein